MNPGPSVQTAWSLLSTLSGWALHQEASERRQLREAWAAGVMR